MATLTLIRHAQANSAARTEAEYDRLSALGRQQAEWLGGHFRHSGERFAAHYSGTLRRQVETFDALGLDGTGTQERDPRLDELDYFGMAQALAEQHGIPVPVDREAFVTHLPQLFDAWADGRIEGARETLADFEARVRDALDDLAGTRGPVLAVTSAGVIGMAMRQALGLDLAGFASLCLAAETSSVHRIQRLDGSWTMTQFNALPHLDTPERRHARSHL